MKKWEDIALSKMDDNCAEPGLDQLHQYLDGELPFTVQPALFIHMASCSTCRRMMDSVMAFRRMSRQEYLALPPSADEVFFERLARQKAMGDRVDRAGDRQPLWDSRRSVTLRSALVLAASVFLIGILVPVPNRTEYVTPLIQLEVERVQFPASEIQYQPRESVIYYMVPGLEITADKVVETEDSSVALESF